MTAPYKGKSEPWTKVCTSEDWTLTTLDVLVVVKVSLMNSDITLSVFKSFWELLQNYKWYECA